MLEKFPHAIGHALRGVGPGLEKTIYLDEAFAQVPETLALSSPAFGEGGDIPAKYTEDGEKISPPFAWNGVPAGAVSLVLVIEDADSPTPAPIVHALVLDLAATDGQIAEGALPSPAAEKGGEYKLGQNTFFKNAYLPPDPPPGGGVHRYVFQLYALDRATGLEEGAGRGAVKEAMADHVIAKGKFIATYERK